MKRKVGMCLLLGAMMALAAFVGAPGAGAAPGTTSSVYVVHGILGVPVDVYVNGALALDDFQPKAVAGPLELPAATYNVQLRTTNGASIIYQEDVAVPAGLNVTLLAHATQGGAPDLTAFVNDTTQVSADLAKVSVIHGANAPTVDIQAGGADVITNLEFGGQAYATLPAGTYPIGVQVAPNGAIVLGPVDLTFPAGKLTNVIAVSTLNGSTLDAVVFDVAVPSGYRLIAADGGVFTFGTSKFFGSTGSLVLNAPVVGGAPTPSGNGYWLVAADGGVFSFGDAQFFGSTGSLVLNAPVLKMMPTPTGGGYWLLAADGGVFSFGDAEFFGSTGGQVLNAPVVAGAATATGKGYWLVALDGGVFTFGDAKFYGSTGSLALNSPVFGITPGPGGLGYTLVALDGGVFTFGNAGFYGSGVGQLTADDVVVGIQGSPTGRGYWMATNTGKVLGFGDANDVAGDLNGQPLNAPVIGIFG